jgi:LacI family transcriptional regulator
MVVRESTDFYAARDEVVAQSQAFIAANCHRPISVMDVAEKASVSVRTLQDRFSKVLGRKVTEEIRRVRIEKAKRELAGSERSIHEIAVRTGFSSNGRLGEAFRRNVGISPSEYRATHRQKRDA